MSWLVGIYRPIVRFFVLPGMRTIHDDSHALEGYQPAADHLVELRKDFLYLFFRIDAFDDDRKILEPVRLSSLGGN